MPFWGNGVGRIGGLNVPNYEPRYGLPGPIQSVAKPRAARRSITWADQDEDPGDEPRSPSPWNQMRIGAPVTTRPVKSRLHRFEDDVVSYEGILTGEGVDGE